MGNKIRFKDLDGWLKFAAIGAILHASFIFLITALLLFGLLLGILL